MTDLDKSMAPGCFGISLLYRDGSAECSTCPFAAMCAPLAAEQLAKLRAEMGIEAQPQQQSNAPTASPMPVGKRAFSTALPVKVQELVDRIEGAGISVCEALKRGSNPFTAKFPFMRVICHLLLKRQGAGLSRSEAADALEKVMKIGRGTADAYTMQAIHALRAIGAADEAHGLLRLRA